MNQTPEEPRENDESSPPDLDAAFNAIVANLRHGERPPETPVRPPPDATDEAAGANDPDAPAEPHLGSQWSGWDDLRIEPPPEHSPAEADEHYVPPPPPPVPRGDKMLRYAWAGAIGAPLVAVLLAVAGWNLTGMVGAVLVSAFLGGFVTLISRMRPDKSEDDESDDGAVI